MNTKDYTNFCIESLRERGVTLEDICECARFLQQNYHANLTADDMLVGVQEVIKKREVQYAIMTAIELDKLVEQNKLNNKDLQEDLCNDQGLYGVDEVLAYGICNLYGSIALTNFGYIDKEKYGIVEKLNIEGKEKNKCHTFLDDIVGAIAASAASRFAHN